MVDLVRAWRRRLLVAAVVVLAVGWFARPQAVAAGAAPDVSDIPDELSPDEDNSDPAHREACEDVTSPAGSIVIRRLVDGPRHEDGSLAFVSGVCIYLPPGYGDGALRYPVLYLLHGAFGWQDDWVAQGGAQAVLDEAYAADRENAMIVVMPDGTYDANWKDDLDGDPRNETYVFDHLIPYVDRYLRTIPTRSGRAMSGLSNGGAGTLRLAALHPDHFGVVTAMSAALPVNMNTDPFDVRAAANDPTEMADNLNYTELALIWGLECGPPDACSTYGAGWAFENVCCNNEPYHQRLAMVGRSLPWEYVATVGAHDWFYWNKWLRENHGPYIRDRLDDPVAAGTTVTLTPPPNNWAFRSLAREISIHGFDVAVDPDRADEFLRFSRMNPGTMTVQGSGTTTISTPPVGAPGSTWAVTGANNEAPITVTADEDGRITFVVDLGEPHALAEYSEQQRLEEAAGDYWVVRTVTWELAGERGLGVARPDGDGGSANSDLPTTGAGFAVVGLLVSLLAMLGPLWRGGRDGRSL